jgi:hypothetical protein
VRPTLSSLTQRRIVTRRFCPAAAQRLAPGAGQPQAHVVAPALQAQAELNEREVLEALERVEAAKATLETLTVRLERRLPFRRPS